MKPLVECLREQLRAYDAAATDTVESILARVRSTQSANACQELSELTLDFEFRAALEQLELLADTLRADQVARM